MCVEKTTVSPEPKLASSSSPSNHASKLQIRPDANSLRLCLLVLSKPVMAELEARGAAVVVTMGGGHGMAVVVTGGGRGAAMAVAEEESGRRWGYGRRSWRGSSSNGRSSWRGVEPQADTVERGWLRRAEPMLAATNAVAHHPYMAHLVPWYNPNLFNLISTWFGQEILLPLHL